MGDEGAAPAAVAAAAVGQEEERGLRPQLLLLRVRVWAAAAAARHSCSLIKGSFCEKFYIKNHRNFF